MMQLFRENVALYVLNKILKVCQGLCGTFTRSYSLGRCNAGCPLRSPLRFCSSLIVCSLGEWVVHAG